MKPTKPIIFCLILSQTTVMFDLLTPKQNFENLGSFITENIKEANSHG